MPKLSRQKPQKANGPLLVPMAGSPGGYGLSRESRLLAAPQLEPHQPLAAMLGDTGLSVSLPTPQGQDTDLRVMESAEAFNLGPLSQNNS